MSGSARRRAGWLWAASVVVLSPVAGIGAALSFQSLHAAAEPVFGCLAFGFPLLVDMLILGATLAYLAGATSGRALPGWRWTAHGGVAATLVLNALAAAGPTAIPWHVTPALVWSVLVEMTARQVTGDWPALGTGVAEPIPARLWVSSPLDATRTWLRMARTGERSHRRARADLAVHAAAVQALRMAMPRRRQRGARRLLARQLRAGAVDPALVLDFLGDQDGQGGAHQHATVVIQAILGEQRPPEHDTTQERTGTDTIVPGSSARGAILSPTELTGETQRDRQTGERDGTQGKTAAERSGGSPGGGRGERARLAAEILKVHPGIGGSDLAQELATVGWQVSSRTARRVLAQAARELASEHVATSASRERPELPP